MASRPNTATVEKRRITVSDPFYERVMLGNLIENPELFRQPSVASLTPQDLSLPSHSSIFSCLQGLYRSASPIDLLTVRAELESRGELERVGGFEYLVSLGDGLVLRSNIDLHVRKVREFARRRQLTKELHKLGDLADDPTVPPSDVLEQMQILTAHHKDGLRAERKLEFHTALEIAGGEGAQVDWIARPYVAAGAVTELVGKPKHAGKTTFATHLAKAVINGADFMGQPTTKTNVLYLTEQTPSTFRPALCRAGLEREEGLIVLAHNDTLGWSWPDVIRCAVERCKVSGAGLLIVDTIGQFAGLAGDAENNAGDALAAMAPLQQAAAEGIAVLVLRHERKTGEEVGESGRGSSAFAGAVDLVMVLRRLGGNSRPGLREIQAVSRFDGTPEKLIVELTDHEYVARGTSEQVALDEGCLALLDAAPSSEAEAMTLDELCEAAKLSRSTGQRVINSLQKEGQLIQVGKGVKGDAKRFYKPQQIHSAQIHTHSGAE